MWKNRYADWLRIGAGSRGANEAQVAAVAAAALEAAREARGGSVGADGGEELRVGVAGIGWGALMALWAGCADAPAPRPGAVAALTPVLAGNDDKLAAALEAPAILLPSKYDSMDRLQVVVSARKEQYAQSVFKRFGHCYPGCLSWNAVFPHREHDGRDAAKGRAPRPGSKKAKRAAASMELRTLRAVRQAGEIVDAAAAFLRARCVPGQLEAYAPPAGATGGLVAALKGEADEGEVGVGIASPGASGGEGSSADDDDAEEAEEEQEE